MCGIAGIFNIEGGAVPVSILKNMTDIIRHRGPDGDGLWTKSCIGFGHRRLAIIDLSPAGHQPMQNEDGSPLMDLKAYKFYYGTSPGNYTKEVRVDNDGLTSFVIENLTPATYFVVATAINSNDTESRFSNEATMQVVL